MYEHRIRVRRRFPDPLGLPLVKRPETLIAAHLQPGAKVIDVGAGDASLRTKLRDAGAHVEYTAVDPEGGGDFRSLKEVRGEFDAALILEVLEHLDPNEGMNLLRDTLQRLRPRGRLFLSTPNVFKPGQYNRDATHCTPYSWEELGALCLAEGLELEALVRVYNAPALSRFLHLTLLQPLHRLLGVDFARSVMAVGQKP
ncbi:MAG: class I SAM-dependent methyltransferase [Planctomycetota bacterium]|jgi:2-polyprenyl-3-methyl-5-hydroxy-6-metoxy-1,4-benzoquinol methylase